MRKRAMSADDHFPIVGIGASAGGLKALESLFAHLPTDTGMAFVIVTRLAPGRESILPAILSRFTQMTVFTAVDGAAIEANRVYVCPPDRVLTVKHRKLHLGAVNPELHRYPIDQFMVSLAEDCGEAAVGILLSGGGSDGTLGIKAIKDHGGLTIAQGRDGSPPPQSAMPDAALAAGVVDLVLSVDAMGPRLAEYARSFVPMQAEAAAAESQETSAPPNVLKIISDILLNRLGHDFSSYKPKTFMRRVRRRMQVLQLEDVDDYVARLRANGEEVALLFRDLLIGVTSFFRDPSAFSALEEQVVPRLFEGKGANDAVRVWVPGCATGEEAYSIAILLREWMDAHHALPKVKIFATDIDEAAMLYARNARYQSTALANVSAERLQRFFIRDDIGYTVRKDIREMCVFSTHNLLRDPPFSRLDLVSCRNLLIYLGGEAQAYVLPILHFALKPGGFLFLGTSENVSQHPDLFAAIDKKQRIFQRRELLTGPVTLPPFMRHNQGSIAGLDRKAVSTSASLAAMVGMRVMERYAPAHVVVNREGDVLYYSARTGKYLEPAAGVPNRQLLAMARKGLRLDLRAALREAMETRRPVERARLNVNLDNGAQLINLTVEPLGDGDQEPLFLVLFQDVPEPATGGETAAPTDKESQVVERLEQELRDTRDRLRLTIEEYETAVEELKSSNEELQSINEELQSTNEELETSKEELQSVNEELNTVNAELNAKVEELDRVNADLRNVFEATQVAIVFLDRNLVIRSFTPAATAIFNLISTDRGRPLTDIVSNIAELGDLRRDIQTVFERGSLVERRVSHKDGRRHYLMRILPYRTDKTAVEGALVTFVDIIRVVEVEQGQR
jgi:two-component system CheB/CheR fusion protein